MPKMVRTTHVLTIEYESDPGSFDRTPEEHLSRRQVEMADEQTAIEELETLLESWRENGDNPLLTARHLVTVRMIDRLEFDEGPRTRFNPEQAVREAAEQAGFDYRSTIDPR